MLFDDNAAVGERPLAGQHLDKLRLAVSGNSGYADDFAGMNLQIDLIERLKSLVVVGVKRGELEDRVAGGLGVAHGMLADLRISDHHARHGLGREVLDLAAADFAAAAQHRHTVAEAQDFAKFVRDHDDSDLLAVRHARRRPSISSASSGVSTDVGSSRISRR